MNEEDVTRMLEGLAAGDKRLLVDWVERYFKGRGFYIVPLPPEIERPWHYLVQKLEHTNGGTKTAFGDACLAALQNFTENPNKDKYHQYCADLLGSLEYIPTSEPKKTLKFLASLLNDLYFTNLRENISDTSDTIEEQVRLAKEAIENTPQAA